MGRKDKKAAWNQVIHAAFLFFIPQCFLSKLSCTKPGAKGDSGPVTIEKYLMNFENGFAQIAYFIQ